jgi:ketosteroid isomerase-like protein
MKRWLWCAVLSVAMAMPAAADKASKEEMAEFKALVGKVAEAWATLDPAKAGAYYAKDADLVYFDIAPLKYAGWTEYDKGVRVEFAKFETLKITPNDDLVVNKHGKIVWTTGTLHMDVKMKGQPGPMGLDARQTLIWEKRDGKWAIIHEHFSTPMPDAPPPTTSTN